MKITKKINFFFYFIFILTIFFINLYCNFLLKDNFTFKEWYFSGQDEIVFIYNALIINAGHVQEYLDHSSFFLILTFTIVYKIISIFLPGFVFDINQFNSSGDSSLNLNTLFTIARIICFLFSIFLSIVTYHLVETITKNKLTSFLLTLIFIFSSGVIINTNIIDSVTLSVIFLLTSSLFLVLFLKKKEGGIFFLFLFFFFFFASILQKIQSFLYLIPIFLSFLSLATKKNNLEFTYLNIQYNKKNYYRIILIVSIIIILKPILIYKSIPSAIFYLLSYYLLNLIFFYYTKKYQKNIFKNLFLFNLIIIFSYLTLKTIVTFYPGTSLEIYNIPFGRIIFKLTRYVDSENYKELYESINISTLIFLKNYLIVFIGNIKIVFANNFLKFNSNSIILYSCLLLFFFKFFYLNFKEKINLSFLIFFFFYSEIINTLRPQPHYAIYSLIFLIFFIAIITQFFNKKFIIYLFLFLVLSLNIVVSTKTIYKVKKSINVYQCLFLENNKEYYTYWTPKINFLTLRKSCIS
jgi:hypothetical protein